MVLEKEREEIKQVKAQIQKKNEAMSKSTTAGGPTAAMGNAGW